MCAPWCGRTTAGILSGHWSGAYPRGLCDVASNVFTIDTTPRGYARVVSEARLTYIVAPITDSMLMCVAAVYVENRDVSESWHKGVGPSLVVCFSQSCTEATVTGACNAAANDVTVPTSTGVCHPLVCAKNLLVSALLISRSQFLLGSRSTVIAL